MYCILLCSIKIKAQELENDYKKLRDDAILTNVDKFYNFYQQELNKDVQTENWKLYKQQLANKIDNLYLLDEANRSFKVDSVCKIQFKEIDIYDKKNRNILKKGINVWKVIEILDGNKITINIIYFKVSYKNKNYQFTNQGGSVTVFEYSCENKKWEMKK
jgi:hypothetical protein